MADKDVLLTEYKSLRDEIMKRQDHRLLILAFTITGSGSVIGLTLGKAQDVASPIKLVTFALISFVLALITAAILLTIQITQQIDVISSYIRKFIEPQLDGIGWEIRWQSYRESKRRSSDSSGLPLGTSKPLAIFYGFLTIATYSLSYAAGIHQNIYAIGVLSLIAVVPLGCAHNLYKRRSKGWRIRWEILDNENAANKEPLNTNTSDPGLASNIVGKKSGNSSPCARVLILRRTHIMSKVNPIPDGASVVMPTLVCRDASAEIDFCTTTFGAVEKVRRPGPDGTVAHALLTISEAMIMIEGEWPTLASRAPQQDGSSPVVIYVYVEDVDSVIERAVAAGARILIPVKDQFWGDRTARIIDPSGHVWTISTRIEETSSTEREDRWSSIVKS